MKYPTKKDLNLHILPNPILRAENRRVAHFDGRTRKLARLMLDALGPMRAVGLAAPQIGVNKRLAVIYIKEFGSLILINPEIVLKEGELDSQEGCLSAPGLTYNIKRAKKVVVKYQDLQGNKKTITEEDSLLCVVLQHEIDHLNSTLIPDVGIPTLK